MRTLLVVLVSCFLTTPVGAEQSPPIPIETWFRGPMLEDVAISPDGERFSMIVHHPGRSEVRVVDRATNESKSIVSLDNQELRLRDALWANDDILLLHVTIKVKNKDGLQKRASRLYSIGDDGKNLKALGDDWPVQDFVWTQSDILSVLPDKPKQVLIQMRMEDGVGVYRMDVRRGSIRRVVDPNEDIDRYLADSDGVVRGGWGTRNGRTRVIARANDDDDWRTIYDSGAEGVEYDFRLLGFDFDGRSAYVASNVASDRMEVFRFDITTGEFGQKVFGHSEVDVVGPIQSSRARRTLQAIRYSGDEPELYFLDPGTAKEWRAIDKALPGEAHAAIAATPDERIVILKSSGHQTPPVYHHFDRKNRALKQIYAEYSDIAPDRLAPMESIRVTARDGRTIPGYLTRPIGSEGTALPLIVYVHLGPGGRDVRSFSPQVQYMVSRGNAVLQLNYRGSTGYGTAHAEAGAGQWGRAMVDDLTDGVLWAVEQGIVDPNRVCILGGEYAGYTAVMAMIRAPEVFKCAASLAGMMDLVNIREDDVWFAAAQPPIFAADVTEADRRAISPLHNVDALEGPIFLAHGTQDARVPVRHAREMAEALDAADKPYEVLIYDQETHGYGEAAQAVVYYQAITDFIERSMAAPPKPTTAAPSAPAN